MVKLILSSGRPGLLLLLVLAPFAHDARGQLWVSSDFGHAVIQFDPQSGAALPGQPAIAPAAGGLDQPHGILDRRSGVLVASFGTHEVKRYDRATGAFIDNFVPANSGLNAPVYLAIGPHDGSLCVSSQGNDRLLRFDLETGAAIEAAPFVSGGQLDGPSGFDWSPDGAVLYVAGRYSANVLAYDGATGEPLGQGHVFASGLGVGSTFGLAVDRVTGDVFVASAGNVSRFRDTGALLATINVPGAIGLENSPDGEAIYAAANNNLYRINKANNAVTGPLLAGASINLLNFFHFSRVEELQISPLTVQFFFSPGGERYFAPTATIRGLTSGSTVAVQSTGDFSGWDDEGVYTRVGRLYWHRVGGPNTAPGGIVTTDQAVTITERETTPVNTGPGRLYRFAVEAK